MKLSDDEERLLKNYRRLKEECDAILPSECSVPACGFMVKKGAYACVLKAEYIREE